jgi:hypothetical protein
MAKLQKVGHKTKKLKKKNGIDSKFFAFHFSLFTFIRNFAT